jgi:3-isopropylmalate dehydrogenase
MLRCTAMLLRHSLGLTEEAAAVERAVDEVIASGLRTADIVAPGEQPVSTREMADAVLTRLG